MAEGYLRWIEEVGLEKALAEARNISWRVFGRRINFYAPSFIHYETPHFCSNPRSFPSISITGSSCALRCKHCYGKILETMVAVQSPDELLRVCGELRSRGARGCLISGGCEPNGSVPLGRFIDAISRVKRSLRMTIVAHTGLLDENTARALKEAGVDTALIDIVGSDETIREILNLDATVREYEASLRALREADLPFVPHVLVGLHYGELRGELQALRMISRYHPVAVIIIAFFPIGGTPMENIEPPKPEDIAKVLVSARLMMPGTPLALGCGRPRGGHGRRTDTLAVRAGINAIAFPSQDAILLAESLGLRIGFSTLCCSQIYKDLNREGQFN